MRNHKTYTSASHCARLSTSAIFILVGYPNCGCPESHPSHQIPRKHQPSHACPLPPAPASQDHFRHMSGRQLAGVLQGPALRKSWNVASPASEPAETVNPNPKPYMNAYFIQNGSREMCFESEQNAMAFDHSNIESPTLTLPCTAACCCKTYLQL